MTKNISTLRTECDQKNSVLSCYSNDSALILQTLGSDKPCFIWETETGKRYSYIGIASEPLLSLKDDPKAFSVLEEKIEREVESELPFLTSLTLGFIAYDALRFLEKVKGVSRREGIPDLYFIKAEKLLVVDHEEKNTKCIGFSEKELAELESSLGVLESARGHKILPCPELVEGWPYEDIETRVGKDRSLKSEKFSHEQFEEVVQRAKEYISAGDVFQVVLANELSFTGASVDPLKLYSYLREHNPSPYHFLIRFGDKALVGASPETFLRTRKLADGSTELTMRPIAGTYPREISADELAKFREDYKERAEHIMLVDHARNDIGRVSKKGSVSVKDILAVETYAKVHHLVSKVSGILKEGESIFSAICACFPIATLTGTPKVRAMEIIAELEGSARGIFGGAVCAFGSGEYFDSAVVIRSAVVGEGEVLVQGGAGIVYDSRPEREYEECLWKMRAVVEGVEQGEF